MTRFAIGRRDGRSNAQVIIDMVKTVDVPGTVFSYQDLLDGLNDGANRTFHLRDVQGCVRQALKRLEKDCQRTLTNVRGSGYRIAFANEHGSVALIHREKGDRQIRRAMSVLENVRWDEMDDNVRQAHQGTLMLTSAMYQQVLALRRRQSAVEHALESLKTRVDSMGERV